MSSTRSTVGGELKTRALERVCKKQVVDGRGIGSWLLVDPLEPDGVPAKLRGFEIGPAGPRVEYGREWGSR